MIKLRSRLNACRALVVAVSVAFIGGCGPGDFVPIPSVPLNLTAVAGNSKVTLTWMAASGATSYDILRSSSRGGPYTQIAAPTSTSYTDSPLKNNTTYYYVVSAVNLGGASANSAEASARPVVLNPPPTTFGTWTNVTPAGVDLTDSLCGNFGAQTVQVDPAHPSNIYTEFNCQGIWKSVDYGITWSGPINTGSNGALVSQCVGGITISPSSTAGAPTVYQSCLRGNAIGFWKSTDGGVNWTNYVVAPTPNRQDYEAPVVDPYDANHLLMAGHEQNSLVESIDGGQNWSSVPLASGMLQNGASSAVFFINTGNSSTTRGTWLWMAQSSGGTYGTWRTTNSGGTWTQVDKNELFGSAQVYQPDNSGVIFMAGVYSILGSGVLQSEDYGQTWAHVGNNSIESLVFGTAANVYAIAGAPVGITGTIDPAFEVGAQPGTGMWVPPGTPAELNQGSAQISVLNDGAHYIFVGAMYNSGVWRYVEP
jgi:hypothetical protein